MTTGHDPEDADEGDDRGPDGSGVLDPRGPCMSCGAPGARIFASPDGPARLCPVCATLEGLGCP